MRMKKVAIAGTIILDVVKTIDVWPEQGMLVNIKDMSRAVGGCVCNTGIDLRSLSPDVAVSAYGRVGRDEYGEYVLSRMAEKGIDTSGVKLTDLPTSFTDVMTVADTGARTFFNMRGAVNEFTEDDIDIPALDCDLFHLGYLLLLDGIDADDPVYGTKAAKLLHDIQARGIKTSIDVVSEQSDRFKKVIPALKYCDFVVINEIEACMISGTDARTFSPATAKAVCEKIIECGVGECVTIHCPSFSCALRANGEFSIVPSLDLPDGYIVGSVGAGDAFCAAMLYSFINGMSDEEGMRLASCAAACNLACADSVGGAKPIAETMELENKFRRKIL